MWTHGAILVAAKALLLPPIVVALSLVSMFYPKLSAAECLTAGVPLGYIFASWLSYVVSCLFGSTTAVAVRVSYFLWTVLALVSFSAFWRKSKGLDGALSVTAALFRDLIADKWLNILSLMSLLYFGFIFFTHSLYVDEHGALWSGGAMWSDLAFHLNVISGFLYGVNRELSLFSRPQSLIFSGHALSYPFIPDYHAASLVAAGAMSVRWAVMLPSILVMVALVVILYSFLRRFLVSSAIMVRHIDRSTVFQPSPAKKDSVGELRLLWGLVVLAKVAETGRFYPVLTVAQNLGNSEGLLAFSAVLLWMLSGSIGGWTLLWAKGLGVTLDDMMEDWMQFTFHKKEMFWFSCVSHVLLPQRSALFAYPIVALVLSCIYIGVNDASLDSTTRRNFFAFAGLLTGIIPLVHAHSFVALGVVVGCYALVLYTRTFSFFFRKPSQVGISGREAPAMSWQEGALGYSLSQRAREAMVPFDGSLFLSWWQYGIPIILLSLPQLPMYLDRLLNARTDNVSFITVSPIWRNAQWKYFSSFIDLNFFALWFRALGFFVPLALAGTFICFDKRQKQFLIGFWLLFVVSNFVQFQPWDKDNNKLFLVWAMVAALAVVRLLHTWWEHRTEARKRSNTLILGDIDENLTWVPRQGATDSSVRLRQTAHSIDAESHGVTAQEEAEQEHWKAAKKERRRRRGRASLFLRCLVIGIGVSLVLSGVFMGIRETMLWWQFMDKEDQVFADWVIANTERDAIFINNDSHIHPITNLAGRQCLFNMAGWIQSHGYPDMWTRRQHLVEMLANGSQAAHLFRKYDISYLVYDWTLNYQYTVDLEFFEKHPLVKTIYRTHKYTIFDVKQLE